MTESPAVPIGAAEVGHTHADVSGGALRASVFGAMDGLVTNIALVAGVGAAGVSADYIVLTGLAGLVAGAFSMAMGEYTSVGTQNEQVDREWAKEAAEIRANAQAEERELAFMFAHMGMSKDTAALAAQDIHRDPEQAALVHVIQELGLDPQDKPSPNVAAVSSFVTFSGRGHPAASLPARVHLPGGRAGPGRCGVAGRRRARLPRDHAALVAQLDPAARLRGDRRRRDVPSRTGAGRERRRMTAAEICPWQIVNC